MSLNKLSWAEFIALFDEKVHDALANARLTEGAKALVLFENADMCSSHLGDRTALRVGPHCTYPNMEATIGRHLNDLPSMRQYSRAYTEDLPEGT